MVRGGIEAAVLLATGMVTGTKPGPQSLQHIRAARLAKALDDGIVHEALAIGQQCVQIAARRHPEMHMVRQDHIAPKVIALAMGQLYPVVEQVVAVDLSEQLQPLVAREGCEVHRAVLCA
jgi:hypothetical protein